LTVVGSRTTAAGRLGQVELAWLGLAWVELSWLGLAWFGQVC